MPHHLAPPAGAATLPGRVRQGPGAAPAGLPALGPVAIAVLAALLVADAVVVLGGGVLHAAGATGFASPRWDPSTDGCWAEVLGVGCLLVAAGVLGALAVARRGRAVLGAWALVLGVVAVDDMRAVHEHGGRFVADRLGLASVLGGAAQDVGELATWAALVALLGSLVLAARRVSDPRARAAGAWVLAALAVTAVAGVGLDAVHGVLEPALAPGADVVLDLLEALGEAAGAALVVVVAGVLARSPLPLVGPVTAWREHRRTAAHGVGRAG